MNKREQAINDLFKDFGMLKRAMLRGLAHVKWDIPPAQKDMMFALSGHEGMKLKEIAASLSITPGAATQLTEALVREGLLERRADPYDRRIVRLHHSRRGMRRMHALYTAREHLAEQLFDGVSDAEIRAFHRIIKKMNHNMEQNKIDDSKRSMHGKDHQPAGH